MHGGSMRHGGFAWRVGGLVGARVGARMEGWWVRP